MPPAAPESLGLPPPVGARNRPKSNKKTIKILMSFWCVFGASWAPLGLPFGGPLGPLGRPSGLKLAPKSVLDGFWAPKRVSSKLPRFTMRNHTFWPPGAPQDGPRTPRKGSKIDPRRYPKAFFSFIKFRSISGPFLAPSWAPRRRPRAPQEAPKRVQKSMKK